MNICEEINLTADQHAEAVEVMARAIDPSAFDLMPKGRAERARMYANRMLAEQNALVALCVFGDLLAKHGLRIASGKEAP